MALFQCGRLLTTPAATVFCGEHNISVIDVLARHLSGDWGDLSPYDKNANNRAVMDGSRIFSAYRFLHGRIWIVTSATNDRGKREATTIMMPEDYRYE